MGIKKKHPQGVEQFADSTNTQADATPHQDYITLDGQMSLFDAPPLKVHNKVRLIELFSGIGAQAKAMQRLGVDWESWGAYDIDPYAVKAYNAIYGTDYVPTDICQMHGKDLNIVDRDKYTYIMTYSFPCQDLSVAGRGKGMAKGSGTRSGLLWEVERLLRELGDDLPQILVMENVKQVIGKKNKRDFDLWREALTEMGYDSQYQVMNAKDYGVAQNRERCFMVSWLGEYSYEFPEPIPLKKRLKDYLEKEVDDKYYLTDEQIATFVARTEEHKAKGNGFTFEPIPIESDTHTHTHTHTAHTIRARYRGQEDNFVYDADWRDSEHGYGQEPSMGERVFDRGFSTDTTEHLLQVSDSGERGGAEVLGTVESQNGNRGFKNVIYGTDGVSPTLLSRDYKDPVRIGWDD